MMILNLHPTLSQAVKGSSAADGWMLFNNPLYHAIQSINGNFD